MKGRAPGGIIRRIESSDLPAATALIRNTLLVSNIGDYTLEEISRLADGYSEETMRAFGRRADLWVYDDQGLVQGVVCVDRAVVQALFVAPDLQGRGIGRSLMRVAEAAARRRRVEALEVPASLTAAGFYERVGFRSLGPGRSSGGVRIERMRKEL